ncbi:uncharacterized protein ACLA_094280 [Aspergillus clavatus NRRL 1]|uniref:GPI anchored serine-threonine rich protein n=1 Tax=Aspergillus clavatus (strain ATCC 1007 / CBS 513.65 / DSM 816 / NCTC 3887 / NRRL 1 / QM 1276 / 107) TaxID=344612 RepID=A1CFS9_ASPCL|nr:uncharacterized protein ACLA_094280 [Aspergillus clavatus NRRL 1]EAW11728.1 conserved hypothetical protein [Aspergillus clavatus NRRL 1]
MLSPLLLLIPLLATQVAAEFSELQSLSLIKRQDNSAFVPSSTPVSECPSGSVECGRSGICYYPSRGDVCCPGKTYACPGTSFCLQDPYCCPEGLDRKTCADRYGVSLQPTFSFAPSQPTYVPSSGGSASTKSGNTGSTDSTGSTGYSGYGGYSDNSGHSGYADSSAPAAYKPSTSTTVPSTSTSQTATTKPSASSGPTLLFSSGVTRKEMAGAAMVVGALGLMANLI